MLEPAAGDVLAAMLNAFQPLLPAPVAGLPQPSLSMARAEMRPTGIGNYVGIASHGSIAAVEQHAVRVQAVIRFTLWGFVAAEVDQAITTLTQQIFSQQPQLATRGVLRLTLEGSSPPEETRQPVAWRRSADYDVLYEQAYEDVGGAPSLILPIAAQETATGAQWTVDGDLGRWDDQAAPPLSVRGRATITALAALTFFTDPAQPPTGGVTITRTFDGAPAPSDAGTLTAFLGQITATAAPARNTFVSLASLADLLARMAPDTTPVAMGDRNNDGIPNEYVPTHLIFPAPLILPSIADRLELSFSQPKFDRTGVLYLRAVRQGS